MAEGEFNNVYDFTYKNKQTQEETTITVRTDKVASKITVENVQSGETGINKAIQVVEVPKVVLKETDYQRTEVKSVISTVNTTKIQVDKVNKIVTETAPTYVTYNMEVISNNKPYEVVVIDNKKTKEIVFVRSTEKSTSTIETVKPIKPVVIK